MKIVINIDDKMYEDIKDGYTCPEYADDIINLIPTSEIYEIPQDQSEYPVHIFRFYYIHKYINPLRA